ncbi:dockerin type I domain-containing protein [Stieleria sp. JC731]|uniref:choice-of-anchor Q domain-containing protein n=1 Tax=Pirellulaceae TaxID=2691357 RepID=UPI001E409B3C|nr:choice-of-anchor Q domain-containing protein [Stieleria sp. JC731]MCC9602648.1 dockerin type I domain-containing protein [Stieleria sp. JC731]
MKRKKSSRPTLEQLEGRRLLASDFGDTLQCLPQLVQGEESIARSFDSGPIAAFAADTELGLLVNTNLDVVDENDTLTSLREAIAFADSSPGEDTISFAPGLSGATITLAGSQLNITDGLTIDASSLSERLTIDAAGQSRVLNFDSANGNLTLDSFIVTGGTQLGDENGGGIRFESDGTFTLRNSVVRNNETPDTGFGGGIFSLNGEFHLVDSVVENNNAAIDGGGIAVFGGDTFITNSQVIGNSSGGDGGGIRAAKMLTVSGSLVSENQSDGGGGGATAGGDTLITNSTFSNNTSGEDGGGFRMFVFGDLNVINSTFSGNSSDGDGGAIQTFGLEALTITNGTIVANESAGQGGGIFVNNTSANAPVAIKNTIVANNTASSVSNDVLPDPEATLTLIHSLIGNADTLSASTLVSGSLFGSTANPLDPRLADLANNGGLTPTHASLAGSPVIDAGNNALAVDANGSPLQFDQRGEGFARVVSGTVDIGAFEAEELPSFVVTTDLDVVDSQDGLTSLREAIILANNTSGSDTITFDESLAGATITLTEGELELRSSLVVEGLGADQLTISGGGVSRVFAELGNGQRIITISDLTIADGKAVESGGGGAFFSNGGDITLSRVVLSNNDTTGGNGSAIVMAFGNLAISDSAIVNNLGTGIGTLRLQDNQTTITNTTISGNATRGISVFNTNSSSDLLSLANVTIANNVAAGIEVVAFGTSTQLEYQNTLFANNGSQGNIVARGNENGLPSLSIVSLGHNLLDDTPTGDAAHDAAAGDLRDTDALLAPLADNGGPTPTHALLEGSPAIDAGNNTLAVDANGNTLASDQRGEGFERVVSSVDIGAFEADENPSLFVTTNLDVVDSRDGLTSLREAINFANSRLTKDTITFDPSLSGSTIQLTEGGIELSFTVTIIGLGADKLKISGNNQFRVFTETSSDPIDVTITDVTIADGFTPAGVGGSAFLSEGSDAFFHRVVMTGNASNGNGSTLHMREGRLEIHDSAIVGNLGAAAGAIRLLDSNSTIVNSTISNNATSGIVVFNFGSTADRLSLRNATIANNAFGGVEAVASGDSTTTLEYQNTLFANNGSRGSIRAQGSESGLQGLSIISLGHNILEDTPIGDALHAAALGDQRETDAKLAPLADNGGPTPTHALQPGSPALNAGNNALAVDADDNPLQFDQRGEGFDRVFGSSVDIGAFESDVVDFVSPQVESILINGGDRQRSRVTEITVAFSEIVNATASDFLIENVDSGATITSVLTTKIINDKTIATLTFSGDGILGGSLADGNYRLTVLDSIKDVSGNVLDGDGDGAAGGNATDEFFRLYGDVNGDRTVNIIDFFQFRNAFGSETLDERFDFNGDGVVNIVDFFQFRSRFGRSV